MGIQKADASTSNDNWLSAHYDPIAGLYTFSPCITLSDLNGDGDNRLVIADLGTGMLNMALKVFKGTAVVGENKLLDLPTGIVGVYMDSHTPRTPGLVVASGSSLFIFKNMKPYYKHNLPYLQVNPEEVRLWDEACSGNINISTLAQSLSNLKIEHSLTTRSLHFLHIEEEIDAVRFVEEHNNVSLKRESVVTCITSMKKSMTEDDAISCVVVGTEHKEVQIIDSEAFTSLKIFAIPDVPCIIKVSGLYDVDFRIFVACRTGRVYICKKDSTTARLCFELSSQIVGFERVHKHLVVAQMNKMLSCFSMKGKLLWSVEQPSNIICTALMDHKVKGFKAVLVGLENCEVRIFREKNLVDTVILHDRPQALCFGRFGREDSTLICVLASGGMQVMILKRTADYAEHSTQRGPPSSQKIKLNIPKKTQLYVDQTVRERESSTEMFQNFQYDLSKMRCKVAQTYLKGLQSGVTPLSDNPDMPLKLSATVQGIGPIFQMIICIENTSSATCKDPKLAIGCHLLFKYSDAIYSISPKIITLPALVPELQYKFAVCIQCITADTPTQDVISVYIVKDGGSKPIVTANISMPVSEGVVVV